MNQNNPIAIVETLIETCRDSQNGYEDAASHVKRADLKTYFTEQGAQRARFADELELELARLGKTKKKNSDSVGGALQRAWIDTKVAVGRGDKSILESVERGEDNAKENYQKALNSNLPPGVSDLVRKQASSILNAHDRVKSLRNAA